MKKAMACQTIPKVAGWKIATMMKRYARPLEAAGFDTWLVNARDVRHLPPVIRDL
jgi:hypothetical protein